MTTKTAVNPTHLVPEGHRYINDYYGSRVVAGNPEDFVALGQWKEYDLYAVKCMDQWSLGARWSNEGHEYMGCNYQWELDKFKRNGKYPDWDGLATNHSMERFTEYLTIQDHDARIKRALIATVSRVKSFNGTWCYDHDDGFFKAINALNDESLVLEATIKDGELTLNGWKTDMFTTAATLEHEMLMFLERHFSNWTLENIIVRSFSQNDEDIVSVKLLMLTETKKRREFSINFYNTGINNETITNTAKKAHQLAIIETFKSSSWEPFSTASISVW